MTEADWDSASDPHKMLDFLRANVRASERKFRLFACACTRRAWPYLGDEGSREAVGVAERYADGLATEAELDAAQLRAGPPTRPGRSYVRAASWAARWTTARYGSPAWAWVLTANAARYVADALVWKAVRDARKSGASAREARKVPRAAEGREQARLLRELFGNPFRPLIPIEPSLLTHNDGLILKLAQAAYEERLLPSGHLDPARLAVLADALEEAGADAGLLRHLRAGGPHVRGCFVIDALRGKS